MSECKSTATFLCKCPETASRRAISRNPHRPARKCIFPLFVQRAILTRMAKLAESDASPSSIRTASFGVSPAFHADAVFVTR
jgi:hypothetical protein